MESYVTKDAFAGRCALDDERFTRDKERIESLEDAMREVSKLSVEIGQMVKQQAAEAKEQKCRVEELEKKPSIWWDRLLQWLLSAVVSGIVAYFITRLV